MTEREIFITALQKEDPAGRQAYLDEACAGQPELRRQVEHLLGLYEGAGSFLEKAAAGSAPTGAFADAAEPLAPTEGPGVVIGPYKLVEPIGEGGMGTVWMAQQTEPVKRLVALKLIKAGMDSKQVIARFEAERQALALMDHPNIARVLEGGTTSAGRPYFVMDLVKGVPLTKYCDEHHLTPRQRLELFIPVCQAVQHAHQKGIIHRDLKPSNILVAPYDGKPVVKVIDFGVAKAAGQQLTDRTLVTGFGAVVGTLEYMSPEQAELNNQDIDTRSDIYSLGVLLYELLAGSPPFSRKELEKAGMLEMLRVIREQEPSKPSTKLSTAEGLPTLAANRGTEPAKLTKLVRGELDWIVMKALEKDRGRRYETANGFAMDVQRYLADEPVQACPPSASYRLRKFVRRNKGSVLAASLLLAALIAGITATSWAMVWAMRERDDKDNALVAEIKEREAKDKALEAESKARTAEQKARVRADDGFAHAQQAVELFFNRVTDDPQLNEKDFFELRKKLLKSAVPFYEWLKEQQQNGDKARAAVGHAYHRLGAVRAATGEPEAALEDYRHMQAIFAGLAAEFARPEYRQELARSHDSLGRLLRVTQRPKEAESAYAEALAIRKKLADEFHDRPEFRRDLGQTYNNLANLLSDHGQLEKAESAYIEAVAIFKQLADDFKTRPQFRHDLAASQNSLGVFFRDTGRLKKAASALAEALAIRKKLADEFRDRHELRHELASSYNNLANVLAENGQLKEAESAHREALAIRKRLAAEFRTRPELRSQLASSYHNLGDLLGDTDRVKEAEAAYNEAAAIQKELTADFPTRPDFQSGLASALASLGSLLHRTRRLKEAESAFTDALAIFKQLAATYPSRLQFQQDLAAGYNNLGGLLADTARLKEAESAFGNALAIFEKLAAKFRNVPDYHHAAGGALGNLARLANLQRRFAAARKHLEAALPYHQTALKANDRNPGYRQSYQIYLSVLTASCAGAGDRSAAMTAAGKRRDVGWNPRADAYAAACAVASCIPIVEKDENLEAAKRRAEAKFYADEAMKMLRDAVAKGFRDAAHIQKDTDLDPLRARDDFKKLVAELKGIRH